MTGYRYGFLPALGDIAARFFRQPHCTASRLERRRECRSRIGDVGTQRANHHQPDGVSEAKNRPAVDGGAEGRTEQSAAASTTRAARDLPGALSGTVAREGAVARSAPRPAPAGAAVPGARTASHPAWEAAAALTSAVPSKLRATWSISPWPPSWPGAASAQGRSSGRSRRPPWSRAHLRRMARAGRPPGPRPARSLTGLRRADRTVGSGRFARVVRASGGRREPLSADHRRAPGARGRQR
jgi:hypothetical protein